MILVQRPTGYFSRLYTKKGQEEVKEEGDEEKETDLNL